MQVGTIVRLKQPCLGNPAGAIGVVFYDYGDGFQAIFGNGSYDGFSNCSTMPNGQVEADYFLDSAGFCPELASYQFTNVIAVGRAFRAGVFDLVLTR